MMFHAHVEMEVSKPTTKVGRESKAIARNTTAFQMYRRRSTAMQYHTSRPQYRRRS
jgi:hypothetical protein